MADEVGGEADWALLDETGLVRVCVAGLCNSGKTFLLNQLSGLALPSSRRSATKGISMRRALLGGCHRTMLLDTEGCFAPVHMDRPTAMEERQEVGPTRAHARADLADACSCP